MKIRVLLSLIVLVSFTLTLPSPRLFAQTNPIFVQLGQAKGALQTGFRPAASRWHRGYASGSELHEQHRLQRILEKRIYGLCMNSRFENNEAIVDWELIPLDVAQGV